MKKMVVKLGNPGVDTNSFAAQPKIIYRAANRYCRLEESLDSEHRIQGLLIVNEPDSWMVNLIAKTGTHMVDPGPSYNCKLPIFTDLGTKDAPDILSRDLEFGREFEFFQKLGATPQPGPDMQGVHTSVYHLEMGTTKLSLIVYGSPERPMAVLRSYGEKNDFYWYTGYGDAPFDLKLFSKPEGIKIEEAKH